MSGNAINGFYGVNLATGAFTLIGQEAFALTDFSVSLAAPTPRVVPEPDSIAMFGLGAVALCVVLRRRKPH